MKKTTIARKVTVDASPQKVWDALADFGSVSRLSPNIVKSYNTSEQAGGVGATRHCDFAMMGAEVEERIVEWNEGKSMKIDVYEVKNMPMITDMKAEFSLIPDGKSTIVSGIFEYNMKGALGILMNNITMKKMNEKAWVKFLAGIKHHLESGEDVEKSTKLDTSTVEVL